MSNGFLVPGGNEHVIIMSSELGLLEEMEVRDHTLKYQCPGTSTLLLCHMPPSILLITYLYLAACPVHREQLKESPTFMVFKPHPELRQDVIPEGITELKNLKDCRQERATPLDYRRPRPSQTHASSSAGK